MKRFGVLKPEARDFRGLRVTRADDRRAMQWAEVTPEEVALGIANFTNEDYHTRLRRINVLAAEGKGPGERLRQWLDSLGYCSHYTPKAADPEEERKADAVLASLRAQWEHSDREVERGKGTQEAARNRGRARGNQRGQSSGADGRSDRHGKPRKRG